MTVRARLVLSDARDALSDLADGVSGAEWRRRWVTAVVLLRAVGHVLDKVDAESNPAMRSAIAEAWRGLAASKPEPKIFWDFIDRERNNVLKEYLLSAGQGVTVFLRGVSAHGLVSGQQPPPLEPAEPLQPAKYSYPMNSGAFAGRDQREVVSEAIEWWERHLDAIDAAAQPRAEPSEG